MSGDFPSIGRIQFMDHPIFDLTLEIRVILVVFSLLLPPIHILDTIMKVNPTSMKSPHINIIIINKLLHFRHWSKL